MEEDFNYEDVEYEDFVANGDWFLDTEANDFSEKLYQDMKERGTLNE